MFWGRGHVVPQETEFVCSTLAISTLSIPRREFSLGLWLSTIFEQITKHVWVAYWLYLGAQTMAIASSIMI